MECRIFVSDTWKDLISNEWAYHWKQVFERDIINIERAQDRRRKKQARWNKARDDRDRKRMKEIG